MSNDTKTNFEFEQTFIPHPQFVEDVRHTFDEAREIVQTYFKKDTRLERSIHFDLHETSSHAEASEAKPFRASVTFAVAKKQQLVVSTRKPAQVEALFEACKDNETRISMLKDARLRCQRLRGSRQVKMYLALKAPKVNGGGAEFEFEVKDQMAALKLMHDYGADNILMKTRFVKQLELGGKMRCVELDLFGGDNDYKEVREAYQLAQDKDLYKLEIEHAVRDDFIGPEVWQGFASHDVTSDKKWRSRKLAGHDEAALADLEKTMRKLQERQAAEARLAHLSQPQEATEPQHRNNVTARGKALRKMG